MMKKQYIKPKVICQELRPETLLCGCDIRNPDFNEAQQCGYEPDGLGFRIFAQNWIDCDLQNGRDYQYCYHNGTVNLFGS